MDPAGGARYVSDVSGSMSAIEEQHDMVCKKAAALIADLCMQDSLLDPKTCEDFFFLISNQNYSLNHPGICKYFIWFLNVV